MSLNLPQFWAADPNILPTGTAQRTAELEKQAGIDQQAAENKLLIFVAAVGLAAYMFLRRR